MFRFVASALALLALAACATQPPPPAPPAADAATTRTIAQGQLVGYVDKSTGAYAWRSVPFAKPPVGELRWRAPRPPEPWAGTREAVKAPPWCPQVLSALDGVPEKRWGEIAGQEDCLYLDIYAPALAAEKAASAKLPVMMWIHGGSNVWGRAEQYEGAALAQRQNVIVVVVQYRMGPLGWFAHPALAEGGALPADASPNFGALDHIRALEWIRDNIAPFGGDAGRVTIFGESAGGHNVAALLASPQAKGLFHRAIIQSGSFDSTPLAEAQNGDRPDAAMKIAPKITGGAVTGAALRAAPLEAIMKAYDTRRGFYDPPRVIADGIVLPKEGLRAGLSSPATFNAVPVMLGANRDEMKLFNALSPTLSRRALGLFPQAKDKALYEAMSAYPSRNWRARAVDGPAARMVAGGHAPVYAYRFDWDDLGRVGLSDLSQMLGAAHSMEIPFVFGRFVLLGAFDQYAFTKANAPGRYELSTAMMSYWANFAATGQPGQGAGGQEPAWAAWTNDPAAPKIMRLDTKAEGGLSLMAGVETQQAIIADLFTDKSLKPGQACQVLGAMAQFAEEMKPDMAARCGAAKR